MWNVVTADKHRVSFWNDDSVLELVVVKAVQFVDIVKTLNWTLYMVDIIVCDLYFDYFFKWKKL